MEVWNPGILPPTLTFEKLRGPHASVPHNPLLAEPMYLTKYIERMGTGIRDMIRRCADAGLPEPEIRIDGGFFVLTVRRKKAGSVDQAEAQVAGQVTGQVDDWLIRALTACAIRSLSSREIQEASRSKAQSHIFRYIECFYNRRRRHSSIGYQAPEEYERLFIKIAV
jgi:predicted HTH transcriptional regulator